MHTIFDIPDSPINVIVRILLTKGEYIILCREKGKSFCFFPGGHLDNGESLITCAKRELLEEIGSHEYSEPKFIGIGENIFDVDETTKQQEINIMLSIEVLDNHAIASQEDHLEFVEVLKTDFKDTKILPKNLKEEMIKYLEGQSQIVYASI